MISSRRGWKPTPNKTNRMRNGPLFMMASSVCSNGIIRNPFVSGEGAYGPDFGFAWREAESGG